MLSSLYISLTGLSAFTDKIGVISNNIANVETTAFKSSYVNFSDMLTEAVAKTGGGTTGCGVETSTTNEVWTQGTIRPTDVPTDLAINGGGFFVVQDPSSGAYYYTRDGSFEFDDYGNMIYDNTLNVQAYPVNSDGTLGALTDVSISHRNSPPQATSEVETTVNLDCNAEDGDTFTSTVTTYDSLGNEVDLTITYTKTATANEWDWTASIPSSLGTVGGTSSGTLTFDSDGQLTSGTNPTMTYSLTNGASSQTITWNIYDNSGNTNDSQTQYGTDSVTLDKSQDGYASGTLTGISINEDGYIIGFYSNGTAKALYQLALANFNNYNGLEKTDGNLYRATLASGQATVGVANTGSLGSIASSNLEASNVGLANEMAEILTAQTAYQANARVFTVSTEMLDVLINLK